MNWIVAYVGLTSHFCICFVMTLFVFVLLGLHIVRISWSRFVEEICPYFFVCTCKVVPLRCILIYTSLQIDKLVHVEQMSNLQLLVLTSPDGCALFSFFLRL